MADLALEAAAEALWRNNFPHDRRGEYPYPRLIEPTKDDLRNLAQAAIAAYLDSLLGGLPEEAVEALSETYLNTTDRFDAQNEFREAAHAFVCSLRVGLEGGE